MDDLQQQIQYALRRYLSRQLSFEAFEDWFVDATWDASRNHRDATELIYAIEGYISDYTSSRVSERQLKRRLRSLAPDWIDSAEAMLAVPVSTKSRRSRSKAKRGATVPVAAAGT